MELAKKFGSEEAGGFVNAVLDRISREARTAGNHLAHHLPPARNIFTPPSYEIDVSDFATELD